METFKKMVSETKSKVFGNDNSLKSKTQSIFNNQPSLATTGVNNLQRSISNLKDSSPITSIKNTFGSTKDSVSNLGNTLSNRLTGNSNNISSAILSPVNSLTEASKKTFNNIATPISERSRFRTISVSSWFSSKSLFIGMIIFVLALLGLNVFTYLAKGTDMLSYFFAKSTDEVPDKTKRATKNALSGINLGTDVLSGMIKKSTNIVADQLDVNRYGNNRIKNRKNRPVIKKKHKPSNIQDFKEKEETKKRDYEANTEDNKIQENKKPGYCYVGSDRGYRSCIKVNNEDECVSKNIFPTRDICINPNLRV